MAGTVQTSQQALGGTDTLSIENGAALSVDDSKAVQWNDPSTDVQISNDGIIE